MRKVIPVLALTLLILASIAEAAVPPSITIQGKLTDASGAPASAGLRLFTFRIFDAESGGTELWPGGSGEVQLIYSDSGGLWMAGLGDSISLGPSVFTGASPWLEITVDDGGNPPETLSRIRLRSEAYSFRSATSDVASNADSLGGLPPSSFALSGHSHVVTGVEILDGSIGFADVGQNGADTGQVMKWDGAAWTPAHDSVAGSVGSGWNDDGNVVRLDGAGDSVGIGTATPAAKLDVVGDVIVSGKASLGPGSVNSGMNAFVAGENDTASGDHSVVTGGFGNAATGSYATVGGGTGNTASGTGATVMGGFLDTASGEMGTVAGGKLNRAKGRTSFAAGYRAKADHAGTFVWADTTSADLASTSDNQFLIRASGGVGIGVDSPTTALHVHGTIRSDSGGVVFPDGTLQATAAEVSDTAWILSDSVLYSREPWGLFRGNPDLHQVWSDSLFTCVILGSNSMIGGPYSTIGGGAGNEVGRLGIVGGGDINKAIGLSATVAGGSWNFAESDYSFLGGGYHNLIRSPYGTIGGGYVNAALGVPYDASLASATISESMMNPTSYSTVAGGKYNEAYSGSFIGGGELNYSGSPYGSIAGGYRNRMSYNPQSWYATIGGGDSNRIEGMWGTICGGHRNSILPDAPSSYFSEHSTIGGGSDNSVSGSFATIPGGRSNSATGGYSLASGRRAKADSTGTFVWADSNDFDFHCYAVNEFAARATGGVRFVTAIDGSGTPTAGVMLAAGGGSWASLSDSTVKEHIRPVDGADLLEAVAQLAVSEWNYKSQPESVRHIGPMAQDFRALFGVGEDERYISQVDITGVALAAIKELHRQNIDLQKRVEQLEARLAE